MRWNCTKKEPPEYRIVHRFLLFPKCIKGETRWLEWATIKQEYYFYCGFSMGNDEGYRSIEWINL
jgi:hypothetical protein